MKSLIQSKTFWVAMLQAIVGGITIFTTAYPGIGGLIVAKSVLDIVIRLMTSQPVTF